MQEDNIQIHVKTQFIETNHSALEKRFVYAYTITIENRGNQAVQLISRFWKIKDGRNNVKEVRGTGVVGEQPRIAPGNHYSYTSSVLLETETGTMEGLYQLKYDNGETFETMIPTFALVPAHAIH